MEASEAKRCAALECIDEARNLNGHGDSNAAHAEIQRAWELLDEALVLCPQNHKARFLLVSCAMNAEDFSRARVEALTIYQQMSEQQKINLGDSVLHLSIAHAAKMLGDNREAIEFAEEATRLYVDDPQPFLILGELLEAQGDLEKAQHCCRKALSFNDDTQCKTHLTHHNLIFAYCCLGCCLMKQGRHKEAEGVLIQAYQMDQSAVPVLRYLSDAYVAQNRLEDALDMAQRAQRHDPEDRELIGKVAEIRRVLAVQRGVPQPSDPREMGAPKERGNYIHNAEAAGARLSPRAPSANGAAFNDSMGENSSVHGSETKTITSKAALSKQKSNKSEEEDANDSFWFCCMDRSGPKK